MYRRLLFIFFAFLVLAIGALSLLLVKGNVNFSLLEDATTNTPVRTQAANTTLRMVPDPYYFQAVGRAATIEIIIGGSNTVESVQFEIGYNLFQVKDVVVRPAGLFQDSLVTLDINNKKNGRYSFAMKKNNALFIKQNSVIASVSFIPVSTASTILEFLPKTSVIARGVNGSALTSAKGATLFFSSKQATVSASARVR
ncbi:MAG TPA: hypothetical protein VJC10_01345 [Patescibacteria group bacterium]|nr:hypothetical protein [Patescibacteria group bacterium]